MSTKIQRFIKKYKPCKEATDWLLTQKDLRTAYNNCTNSQWMWWAIRRLDLADKETFVKYANICADHVKHLDNIWSKNAAYYAAAAAADAADAADAAAYAAAAYAAAYYAYYAADATDAAAYAAAAAADAADADAADYAAARAAARAAAAADAAAANAAYAAAANAAYAAAADAAAADEQSYQCDQLRILVPYNKIKI